MLFEIFLMIGITVLPISLIIGFICYLYCDNKILNISGIILSVIGIACLILAVILLPIPIIPQT